MVPTEAMLPVTAPAAPILNELEDDEPAALTLHAGDLVVPGVERGPLRWHAAMEGGVGSRDGMTFDFRPTSGSVVNYGFRSDFGAPIRVPTASWICARIHADAKGRDACATSLVRARAADGTILAWSAFGGMPSPLASIRDGRVRSAAIGNVTSGRLVELSKTATVVLATVRSASPDGRKSGGALIPVVVNKGALTVMRAIALDEVDATSELTVTSRLVTHAVTDGVIHVTGTRRVVNRADAKELESAPIAEIYPLASLAPAN